MHQFLRNNGLSLVMFGAFICFQFGVSMAGLAQYNEEQREHHKPPMQYMEYVRSNDFIEITMENWESEFLQMFAYIVLTVFLFQKGSAESKDPDASDPVDADPRNAPLSSDVPGPVKKGGVYLKLYENSLGLTFLTLFLMTFVLHAIAGTGAYNEAQLDHGSPTVTVWEYLISAQFWFESLQNWQSEFFSMGLMVVLTVYLRQRGSPESKPVATPHHKNG